jgi:hydroxyethylthiazole kinase
MSVARAASVPIEVARDLARRVRERRPVVHCITNLVTIGRVADALAALGARPVMASAPEEAAGMVRHAQALVLNLGTPSAERWQAARWAGVRASELEVPVIVDPVGCGTTDWRTEQCRALVRGIRVAVVRGNVPEVAALAELETPVGVKGVGVTAEEEIGDRSQPLIDLAQQAARTLGACVMMTGRVNTISDGRQTRQQASDIPALEGLVGAGDVLTAVIAAGCAVEDDPMSAASAGLALFTAAARQASAGARGPGSFWMAFLDALGVSHLSARDAREERRDRV